MIKLHQPTANITMELFYEKNKEKLSSEGNLVSEGKIVIAWEGEDKTEFKAFVAKDGMVVVEDWDSVGELLMSSISPDISFVKNGETAMTPAYFDDSIEWMRTKIPGVVLPPEFEARLKQMQEWMDLESPKKPKM